MRLAERRQDGIETIAAGGDHADRPAPVSGAVKPAAGTAPAASLTAALIRRRGGTIDPALDREVPADARAQQAALAEAFAEPEPETVSTDVTDSTAADAFVAAASPEVTEFMDAAASSDAVDAAEPAASPDAEKSPGGTHSADAVDASEPTALPDAAAAPIERATPTVRAAPVERETFQSVRESAAQWNRLRAPSARFWDGLMKDVSIFTIFFAVLVFVILQIM